jgi:hypothetical protein
LSALALPLTSKQLKLNADLVETSLSCFDDDRVETAVGQTCQELANLGACKIHFCPECKYSGFCDKSCGYCDDASNATQVSEKTPLVYLGRGMGGILGAGFASWAAPFK